jgi:hypothetical protein
MDWHLLPIFLPSITYLWHHCLPSHRLGQYYMTLPPAVQAKSAPQTRFFSIFSDPPKLLFVVDRP